MPRKTIKSQQKKSNNRLALVEKNLIGTESADAMMAKVEEALKSTQTQVPVAGNYYVFTYVAAKRGLLTDLYPLVAVTGVYDWGFTGINMHLGQQRNYNYPLMMTPMYEVKSTELDSARNLPLKMLVKKSRLNKVAQELLCHYLRLQR